MKRKNKLNHGKQETGEKGVLKTLLFFFLAAFLFLLWGSWLLPVTDPVESNYALTAKEMVLSGNWISPQIYGRFWYDKPIFYYWELALSFALFGFNEMAARLPAAIAARRRRS